MCGTVASATARCRLRKKDSAQKNERVVINALKLVATP
jgi:hypothetical protein